MLYHGYFNVNCSKYGCYAQNLKSFGNFSGHGKSQAILKICHCPLTFHISKISGFWTKGLSLGRKTVFSLMGAGFHGVRGLKAAKNGHIWSTFVIPRLLYSKRKISNL